jgi:predicted O-methyltransferase YrrM
VDITNPEIDRYLDGLIPREDPVLIEMEAFAKAKGFPIVGAQVGRLLSILARATGAKRILELGSGFGYSAYWFAQGMGLGGTVTLTDLSAERLAQAADFLGRAGLSDRIRFVQAGDATTLFDQIEGPFDIVFCDIDKQAYPQIHDVAADLLRPGGLFITDNMLWFGRVLDADTLLDSTKGVLGLTEKLFGEGVFESVILPLRDGVSVAVKRS